MSRERRDAQVITLDSASMTPVQRTAAIARFHINPEDSTPPAEQQTARFIVATSAAIAVGLTLAEAINVTIIEPDYIITNMIQSWGRHCRQGNKNKLVYSILLTAKDNMTEEKIMIINSYKSVIEKASSRKVESSGES